MHSNDDLKGLLASYELEANSGRFVLGSHNTGITVYSQTSACT